MKAKLRNIASVITSVATIATVSGIGSLVPFAANAAIVDGDLIRATGTFDIYIVKLVGSEMYRRLILNPDIFNQYGHLKWSNVQDVAQSVVNQYTDSQLVRMDGDAKVYQLVPTGEDTAAKHHVLSEADFLAGGFSWNQIYVINAHEHNNTTTGAAYVPPVTPPPTAGAFEVKLSSTTPTAATVALGVVAQPWTKVDFKAGSESVTVSAVKVTKSGLHDANDVSDVRLFDGSTQLGGTQAFNTTTNQASFTGLNWVIPANTTKVLTISLSIAVGPNGTVGNTIVVGVNSAADITATKTASGTFPVNGASFSLAGVDVGTLTVTQNSLGDANVLSGSTHQQLASWKFASATETINLSKLVVTNNGSATDADVSTFVLEYSGTVVASATSMVNGQITFNFSPVFQIPISTTRTLYLYGNIASGVITSRTFRGTINLAQNVVAAGSVTGGALEGTSGTGSFPVPASSLENIMTINQGSLVTSTYTATQPSTQDYVKGTTQRLFTALQFSAGAVEGVRVVKLVFTENGGGTCAVTDLSNVTLYDYNPATATETQVGSSAGLIGTTVTFGSNTANAFDTSGLFDIAASGNKYVHVRADIPTGAATGNDCALSIAAVGDVKADGLSSMNDIPSGSVTGTANVAANQHNISASGTITAALNGLSPSSSTVYANGQTGVVLAKYDLTAASGEDILVSSLQFDFWETTGQTDAAESTDIANAKLMNGTTQVGSTVASPTGTATFSPNLIVGAGKSVTLSLVVDIPSAASFTTATQVHADLDVSEASVTGQASGATASVLTNSADVVGNNLTVTTGTLDTSLVQPPTTGNVIKAGTGVDLLKILFTAGVAETVRVTSVKFTVAGDVSSSDGNPLGTSGASNNILSNVNQLGFYVDGVLQGSLKDLTTGTNIGTVTFSGLAVDVTAGGQRTAVLKGNVLAGGTTGNLMWAIVADNVDITATGLSSNTALATGALTGIPNVASETAGDKQDKTKITVIHTLAAAGTLTVAAAAADAETTSRIVLAGATNEVFSKVKFTASTDEDIVVAKVRVVQSGGVDSDFAAGGISVWDGTTNLGSGTLASSAVDITFSPYLVVAKGTSKTIAIKGSLVAASSLVSGSSPMASGNVPQLGVAYNIQTGAWSSSYANKYNIGSVGVQSGATITTTASANLLGSAMTLRKTMPTVTLTSGWAPLLDTSPSDNTEVMRFTVSANANQDVDIYRLTWAIGATDNASTASGWNECDTTDAFQVANFKLYDSADLNTELDVNGDWGRFTANGTTACPAGGTDIGFISWADASSSPLTVAAGTSRTFVLRLDTLNSASPFTGTGGDSLGFTLKTDTSSTVLDNNTAVTGNFFLWRDGAVSSHISGYQVKNLDLGAGSVTF